MEFQDRFVAFVDILGFKGFVERAEAGATPTLKDLLEVSARLEYHDYRDRIWKRGSGLCPMAASTAQDLDYQVTQVSDCVVISAEVSPAGVINVISHCWGAVLDLLLDGYMCRGYITRGQIYHKEGRFVGSGYQQALEKEGQVAAFKRSADDRGTPFVEVDAEVVDYALGSGDECVEKMFRRMVHDEKGTSVLLPFTRLSHDFIVIGGPLPFDAENERRANQQVRELIRKTQERVRALVDAENPKAVRKAEHYLSALDRAVMFAREET